MSNFETKTLVINGYGNDSVPNRFLKQTGQASELAVLLPGLRYTCDLPLLYYPTQLLTQRGVDVLQLQTDYTRPAFQSAPRPEQTDWLAADAQAAVQTGRAQRNYARLILIGKSIGTSVLAYLVTSQIGADAVTIWLTPLLRQIHLVRAASQCKGPALFLVGTDDPTYDPAAMAQIKDATGAQVLALEGANHSLERPGDVIQSLRLMERSMQTIADFLDRVL